MNHWSRQFRWQACLLWSGVLLLICGFIAERSWQTLPLPRALETALLGLIACGLAGLLHRLLRLTLATALLVIFLTALTVFVGVLPMLAMLILAGAGFGVGRAIATDEGRGSVPAVAGIGLLAGMFGWLLPYPVHYRLVYLLLLSLLCVGGWKHLRPALRDGIAAWRNGVGESPALAAFAVLVVGLASAGCWLPSVQFDDLAYHLGLPSQLTALGYYRMDVHSQIWALAPWSGDVVQAIAQVLAGVEARGAVDAFWLVAAMTLTWQLAAALDAPVYARWLSVALVASLPLTAALVGGMQAELPATAASLALALTVATAPSQANLRQLLLFAILTGFLLGLKAGFLAIGLPLGLWLAWRWRGQWSPRMIFSSLLLLCAVGGSSYVYAAILTGNPLFPLFNGFFHSEFFAGQNLADSRWAAPAGWDILWQLTFHTRAYLEGWDGAAGFSLLGLLGAIIVALASRRLRPLALVGVITFTAAIATVHYFRYAFPALVLLTPVAVAAVAATTSQRSAAALLIALTIANLAYQSCAYWTLHVGGVKRTLTQWDREPVTARLVPERALIEDIRQQDATANVLLCAPDAPFAAELAGRGFVTAWYDPELKAARETADADSSGAGWRALFARTGASYAITNATRSGALIAALADAQLQRELGTVQLWKLPPLFASTSGLARERDLSVRLRP